MNEVIKIIIMVIAGLSILSSLSYLIFATYKMLKGGSSFEKRRKYSGKIMYCMFVIGLSIIVLHLTEREPADDLFFFGISGFILLIGIYMYFLSSYYLKISDKIYLNENEIVFQNGSNIQRVNVNDIVTLKFKYAVNPRYVLYDKKGNKYIIPRDYETTDEILNLEKYLLKTLDIEIVREVLGSRDKFFTIYENAFGNKRKF